MSPSITSVSTETEVTPLAVKTAVASVVFIIECRNGCGYVVSYAISAKPH